MRRTTRRTTLALVVLTLALAGCGAQADGGKGGDRHTVAPSPTTSRAGCTARAELGVADSGRTVCLVAGDTVRISPDGTAQRPWRPVAADGSALEAANSGFVVQPGDASAAFKAVSAGKARLASTRPLCAAETGRISCKGLQEWWVTVVVK